MRAIVARGMLLIVLAMLLSGIVRAQQGVIVHRAENGDPNPDGVIYRVVGIGPDGMARELFAQQYNEHRRQPVTVDLWRYAGQRITLRLITDCGPADNTIADHALWAEPRIIDQEERLEVRCR